MYHLWFRKVYKGKLNLLKARNNTNALNKHKLMVLIMIVVKT